MAARCVAEPAASIGAWAGRSISASAAANADSAEESCAENPQSVIDGIAAKVPIGRLGDPKEIGYLAAFLASDEAAYITGTEVLIDGALTLPETGAMGLRD